MHKFSSCMVFFVGLCLFTLQTQADAVDCPPPTVPLTSTLREIDSGVVTVVGSYNGDTRTVSSNYRYPNWMQGQVGEMQVTGEISLTNNSQNRRKLTYRMSVLLPEGSTPEIRNIVGDDGSVLCWEQEEQRIIVVYETVLNAGQAITIPVNWDVLIRGLMFADLNNDGRVDGVDQTILLESFGTDNALADLNSDGVVNGVDLGILLLNWSDYSDDVIEVSSIDVTPEMIAMRDRVTMENNPHWANAEMVAAGIVTELDNTPDRNSIVPFQDWRHLVTKAA